MSGSHSASIRAHLILSKGLAHHVQVEARRGVARKYGYNLLGAPIERQRRLSLAVGVRCKYERYLIALGVGSRRAKVL